MRWCLLALLSLAACRTQPLVTTPPRDAAVADAAVDFDLGIGPALDLAVSVTDAGARDLNPGPDGSDTACRGLTMQECEASSSCVGYSCTCNGGIQMFAGCYASDTNQASVCASFCSSR